MKIIVLILTTIIVIMVPSVGQSLKSSNNVAEDRVLKEKIQLFEHCGDRELTEEELQKLKYQADHENDFDAKIYLGIYYSVECPDCSKYLYFEPALRYGRPDYATKDEYWDAVKKKMRELAEKKSPGKSHYIDFSNLTDRQQLDIMVEAVLAKDFRNTTAVRKPHYVPDKSRFDEPVIFQDVKTGGKYIDIRRDTPLYSRPKTAKKYLKTVIPKYSVIKLIDVVDLNEPVTLEVNGRKYSNERCYKVKYKNRTGYIFECYVSRNRDNSPVELTPLTVYYRLNKNQASTFIPYVGFSKIKTEVQQRLERDRFAIVDEYQHRDRRKNDMIAAYYGISGDHNAPVISSYVTTDLINHSFRTLAFNIQKDFEYRFFTPLVNSFIIDMAAAIVRGNLAKQSPRH